MSAKLNKIAVIIVTISIIAFPLGGCATTKQPRVSKAEIKAEKERAKIESFKTYRKRLPRLHNVAYPLLIASKDLTKKKRWSYGLVFDSLKNYEKKDRELTKRAFPELTDRLTIIHINEGSPAATSGLILGDVLEEYKGKKIAKPKDLKKAFKPLSSDERPGPGTFFVVRDGRQIEVSIEPEQIARFGIILQQDQMINAKTDGKNVYVSYGMLRFAESDDELALVIGHELAHNIEGHIGKQKLKAAVTAIPFIAVGTVVGVLTGINIGPLLGTGMRAATAKYSRNHEREADYVGTYIAARAGYNIDDAAGFWRRFASEVPNSMKQAYDSSHPSSPERAVRIEKVIAEIKEKEATELSLLPERK